MIDQDTILFIFLGFIVGLIAGLTSNFIFEENYIFTMAQWLFIGILGGLLVKLMKR